MRPQLAGLSRRNDSGYSAAMSENPAAQPEPEPEAEKPEHPNDRIAEQVSLWAKATQTMRACARKVGITEYALSTYYRDVYEQGRDEAMSGVLGKLLAQAMAGNANAANKWAELMGLKPAGKVELTGKDGGPIEHIDLSRLSAEELELYGRLAAKAEGLPPDALIVEPIDSQS